MAVKVVSLSDIPVQQMPGRELQWLVTKETVGAEIISMAVMDCPAGATVRPLHAHKDVEEIIYILEGEGEALVDGEVGKFKEGDAVLFPANSKHMVRNTGTTSLRTCSIFAPPTSSDNYILYEGEGW